MANKMLQHPTVRQHQAKPQESGPLDAAWLKKLCLEAGADDVGFVALDRSEIDDQRAEILQAFPHGKTLISLVQRMNREPLRSAARSAANLEFHQTTEDLNATARSIVRTLEDLGIRAFYAATGFPMEMDRFPGKIWVISHKPVAVAAGLGQMGIHRNVIHPRYGNFILLDTVVIDREVSAQSYPLDYNPCLECKLCVAACPVGAIGSDGHFDFSACMTHNYREFMGGFNDWVGKIADSADRHAYAEKVSDSESASMWQSLAFGPNYKAAYCLSVCPAGSDVIAPFLEDRPGFLKDVVRPLQDKVETLYVISGSDAEGHALRRFPHKKRKVVPSALRIGSIAGFRRGLQLVFQRRAAGDLKAIYRFVFSGQESDDFTVKIESGTIQVGQDGHAPDLTIHADSQVWIRFLRTRRGLPLALLTRKLRLVGKVALMRDFQRCFPS